MRAQGAGEGGGLSIWWSGALDLPDSSALDARYARPLQDPIDEMRQDVPARAVDCASLLALRGAGYEPRGNWAFAAERAEGARCLALSALRGARAARLSQVADFRLDGHAAALLPAALAVSFSRDQAAAALRAAQGGVSWQDWQPALSARAEGDRLVITDDVSRAVVRLYARADFDGDGIEDLLVAVDEAATSGSYENTRLWLLTRRDPGGVLSVLRQLQ
ncbi:MAG: hypothetical protein JNJ60_10870 [Rhodocyclaceae bacterium]|nr:hypothetical protein [Rhodocyclaceae bacterium]